MTDKNIDPTHFTKAVTELGEQRPVVTTAAVFNDRGVKIVAKGVAVNPDLYERLMAHKLSTPLEHYLAGTPNVSGHTLRVHAEQAMSSVAFFERIGAVAKTRSLLLGALEAVPLPDAIAFQIFLASELRPELFHHSITVALIAAWMSQGPMVSRFDVGVAAAAGLLHDLGMLHLDPALLKLDGRIAPQQRLQLYAHPTISCTLIERHHEYPRELMRAVGEHHEFLNGSGYPRNLNCLAISPLGRMLSLAELVASMMTNGREASESHLWVQLKMNKQRYDAVLVERLEQLLAPTGALQGESLTLIDDPATRLREIDEAAADWPADLALRQDLSPPRRAGMAAVSDQATELHQQLAKAGVTAQQLAQLGEEARDQALQPELTLLAHEAAWQLRALARQAIWRWDPKPTVQYPDALQTWLNRAEALVGSVL